MHTKGMVAIMLLELVDALLAFETWFVINVCFRL